MAKYSFFIRPQIPRKGFEFGNIESDYGVNSLYWTKNSKPFLPVSGEFHFSRYDNSQWKRELLKMKASGLNFVSTYIFWNHHEYDKGEYDFEGDRDINKFLSVCREIDMPCILRIGPWAHGECVYGGFPKYVQKLAGKRSNNKKYLEYVKTFWRRLYEETKEYCDGKTVVAIQLENEYNGNIGHIHTLKEIAEDIGFKTPFFTMTAWPTNTPDKTIMPMFGGYPEAPWAQHKRKLKPERRFAICEGRTEQEIGEDLIKKSVNGKVDFKDLPYAGCEVGTGNQVTQHRRPLIDDKDGYGVAFAKLASGMNWLGYYMYHGGRNPLEHLYQESRRTLYPNNYPIVDYDFQAPFSKDGAKRKSCDRLRLLHTFLNYWDKDFATKQAYFSASGNKYPYISLRCDKNMSGYVFISNYERGEDSLKDESLDIELTDGRESLNIENITVAKGAMTFFPVNFHIDGKKIDYVFAQPLAKIKDEWYFCECEGMLPYISVDGKKTLIDKELKIGKVTLKILDRQKACEAYVFDGKMYFDKDVLYSDKGAIFREFKEDVQSHKFSLEKAEKEKLPYGYYLYSHSPRYFYKLHLDRELLKNNLDVELRIKFDGLNLQLFAGKKLIDDYLNTDGYYVLRFRQIARYIKNEDTLTIKAVGGSFGIGNVYKEISIPKNKAELSLESVSIVNCAQLQ